MKKIILLFLPFTFLLAAGCDNNAQNQTVCTDQYVYGLNIIVLDATTGNPIFQDIEVKAVDGTYQEILQLVPGLEYAFAGAGERIGTYTITVTKEGFQTYTSGPITVTRDDCHVIPQSLTVNLQSN
ncbi:MAG: hypothetical protein RL427_208 [Bacteroidota bacterium]|jgi:hypothetical protein